MVKKITSTLRDGGNTASLVDKTTSEDLAVLRGLEAGSGITINVVDADDNKHITKQKKIQISTAGAGEANAGVNLGGGAEVYAGKTGPDLQFRSVQGSGSVEVTQSGNVIVLSAAPIPTALSQLSNDADYITEQTATSVISQLMNDVGYITVDTATSVISQLVNDAGYITEASADVAYEGKGDLSALSQFNNDANYVTEDTATSIISQLVNDAGYVTEASADTKYILQGTEVSALSQLADDINVVTVDTATSVISQLMNDAGYITEASADVAYEGKGDLSALSQFNNDAGYITEASADVAYEGKGDLSALSQFNNDADYITEQTATSVVSQLMNDAGYITEASADVAYEGKGDLSALSQFGNDVGYMTAVQSDTLGAGEMIVVATSGPETTYRSIVGNGAVEVTGTPSELVLSAAPNPTNLSDLTNDVGYITEASANALYDITTQNVVWVDPTGDDTTGTGNFNNPYATINQALSVVGSGDVVGILPGNYNENVTLAQNVVLVGYDGPANIFKSQIRGQVTINSGQVNLKNLTITNPGLNPTDYALVVNNVSTTAGCKIEDCILQRPNNTTDYAANFTGGPWSGSVFLKDIWSNASFAFNQDGFVRIDDADFFWSNLDVNVAGATVQVNGVNAVGTITHTAGNLVVLNARSIRKNASDESIISSCSVADGSLVLGNISTYQDDLTVGRIVKSGNCAWSVANIASNTQRVEGPTDPGAPIDWFNGPKLSIGTQSLDVLETYTPSNYTGGDYVTDHFEGVDAVLGNIPTAVSQLSNDLNFITQGSAASEFTNDPAGVYFVASDGDDNNDGSMNSPFATVQQAVNALGGSTGIVEIFPGSYTGDVTISNASNMLIQGWGVAGSHPIELIGKITIDGTSTRVRIKDLQVDGNLAGTDYSLVCDSSQGRHYFENVNFQSGTSGAVRITGTELRWHDFIDCDIEGELLMDGTPSGTSAYLRGGNAATLAPVINTGYKLTMDYLTRIGTVTHNGGKLYIRNQVDCNAATDAIISTASNPADILVIIDSTFQEFLDDSLVFHRINKTGTCDYIIHNVRRDVANDVLTGTRIDMRAGYDIGEYTVANLPDPAANQWSHAIATDALGGRTLVRSDGTNWKIIAVEGGTVV